VTRALVIDNYDSFTYNLVDYIATAGAQVRVERNDAIAGVGDLDGFEPTHLVISPGPGTPAEAGVSRALIEALQGTLPVLGVCLGHQVIVDMCGGTVGRAARLMHGKSDMVSHDGSPLYDGLANPFEAGRYHSLAAIGEIPEVLAVTARTADGEVMGVRHRELNVHGVQFHPESVLTPHGRRMIENFLAMSGGRSGA
jgi:anthranilate synthase/aminodeoxychorismate synthase-like glutamine amidotransferase